MFPAYGFGSMYTNGFKRVSGTHTEANNRCVMVCPQWKPLPIEPSLHWKRIVYFATGEILFIHVSMIGIDMDRS